MANIQTFTYGSTKNLNSVQEHPRQIREKFPRLTPQGGSVWAQTDQVEVFMMIQDDRESEQD